MNRINIFAMIAGMFGGSGIESNTAQYIPDHKDRIVKPPRVNRVRSRGKRYGKGIKESIKSAPSKYHIDMIMVKANMFEDASDETKRKWAKARAQRFVELGVEA